MTDRGAASASQHAKVKTDAIDVAALAQLLRSEGVPEAHMVSVERREARTSPLKSVGI